MKKIAGAVLLLTLLVATWAIAGEPRSAKSVREFRKTHPCPATGKTTGKCAGWVVDHVYPLCAGGADAPSNMAWQEYGASLQKDRLERDLCACRRKN